MIELSMDEWGKRLLQTGRYITLRFNYNEGCTFVRDTSTGNDYKATYNTVTQKMNLVRA